MARGERMMRFREKLESISLLGEFLVVPAVAAPYSSCCSYRSWGRRVSAHTQRSDPTANLLGLVPFISLIILGLVHLVMAGE